MDRRVQLAIGILVAAAFGYWFFQKRRRGGFSGGIPPEPPGLQDQGPAQAAQANYTVPPNVGMQMNQPGQTFLNGSQTMPLPYNT